jgi:hypothetical protein
MTVDDLSHLQPPFQEAARLSNAERIGYARNVGFSTLVPNAFSNV